MLFILARGSTAFPQQAMHRMGPETPQPHSLYHLTLPSFFKLPGQRLLEGLSQLFFSSCLGQPRLHRACLLATEYEVLCGPMSRLSRPRCRLSHSSHTPVDKSTSLDPSVLSASCRL